MKQHASPQQSIFLFKDKDGLYEYNPATKKEKLIFKANDQQVFLNEAYALTNNILTVGFKGDLEYVDSADLHIERYYRDYYSIDLTTGKSWPSKKVFYEVPDHKTLKVKTILIDMNGNSSVLSDTLMEYRGSSTSGKGVEYNNFAPRFFSSHTAGTKSVFSKRGNIYYVSNNDTTLLVEYTGGFDPKFGSGYYQPQLDPTGEYVVFRFLPRFMDFRSKESLQKITLSTKKIEILKNGEYSKPVFSADGKFILFTRDQKEGKLNTWISNVYVLELSSLCEKKIGEANSANWK